MIDSTPATPGELPLGDGLLPDPIPTTRIHQPGSDADGFGGDAPAQAVQAAPTDPALVTVNAVPVAVEAAAQSLASAKRKIEYLRLEDLKPDPRNPKNHSYETIDESFNRFGVVDIITRDDRTGYIISGHGRRSTLADAMARGDEPPEGVIVAEDGMWLVPVTTGWSSKSDAEAAAALISMNRTTEMGGWVDDSLLKLLDEITSAGEGFAGIGYDDEDYEALKMFVESADMELDPSSVAAREQEWAESGGNDLEVENLMPQHRIVMKFQTDEDYLAFLKLIDVQNGRDIIRGGTWWPAEVRERMRQSERDEELVISDPRAQAPLDADEVDEP